ncbi:MAG: hypothetical protein Q9218_000671 [Villophora microphyllina]
MSLEPQIALSLTASPDIIYDLWQGFLSNVHVNLQSGETPSSLGFSPIVEYAAPGINYETVSPVWALAKGLLTIKDGNGAHVVINHDSLFDITPCWNPTVHFLRGSLVNQYKFDRFPKRLLKELKPRLRPGESYTLGFAKETFPMQAALATPDAKRLQLVGDDRWINTVCDDSTIKFRVVPGIRVPRFSVALSAFWDYGLSVDTTTLTIELEITSLDTRHIKIKMPDPKHYVTDDGLGSWVMMYDIEGLIKPFDWCDRYHQPGRQTWRKGGGEFLEPFTGSLVFCQGTSYICRCQVPVSEFESYTGGRRRPFALRLIPDQSGFSNWKPFDEESEDSMEIPKQWPNLGCIEFEPVVDGWDKIERMLEQERPMPLFSLPAELRCIIYDYVKFCKSAEEVLFTYKGNGVLKRRELHGGLGGKRMYRYPRQALLPVNEKQCR